jgi:hypothetical protein
VVVERRGEDKAVVGRQLRAAVVVKEVGGSGVVRFGADVLHTWLVGVTLGQWCACLGMRFSEKPMAK